jgi:hypothetical protein
MDSLIRYFLLGWQTNWMYIIKELDNGEISKLPPDTLEHAKVMESMFHNV